MRTASYTAVPGCPRVEVLSIDYDKAAIRSDEAEPGAALLIVPVSDLSSFEEKAAPTSTEPHFALKVEMGNAAMLTFEDVADEVRTVLTQIEEEHDADCTVNGGTITDRNGNSVGSFTLVLPEPETQTIKARSLEAGQRVKIGDTFERIEAVGEMPGGRVEVITEPYSEGVLWEGDQACEILLDGEAV